MMITFHEIYDYYAKDVYRYACWLCGSADEITSETFARAWVGKDAIRTETVKAYLFVIARNLYLQSSFESINHYFYKVLLDPFFLPYCRVLFLGKLDVVSFLYFATL